MSNRTLITYSATVEGLKPQNIIVGISDTIEDAIEYCVTSCKQVLSGYSKSAEVEVVNGDGEGGPTFVRIIDSLNGFEFECYTLTEYNTK